MLIGALLGMQGTLLALTFGPEILTLLYKSDYRLYRKEIMWLEIAGGIGYVAQFTGYALTAAGNFQIQVPLIASVTLMSAVGSALLVPKWGVLGAALAIIRRQ